MTLPELAVRLVPIVEQGKADGLPQAMTERVLWVVERGSKRKRPFRTVFASDESFLEAVRQAQPAALELAVAFAPTLSREAAELPYQVLAQADSRSMQDAALEGIASIGDRRAFCALLEHDSARAQTLYSGRVFEGALPLVEERLDQALVAEAGMATKMEPRQRMRTQALLMHLARHPETRCRNLVFETFASHAERELQYTAGAVLLWWGDTESLDALALHIDDTDARMQHFAIDTLFRRSPRAVYDHFGGDALLASKDHALVARLLTEVGRDRDRKHRDAPLGVIEADERWLELALRRSKDRRKAVQESALYVLESAPPELVNAAEASLATKKRQKKGR